MPEKPYDRVERSNSPATLAYEWVTLNRRGELVARTPGQARQIFQDLGGGVRLPFVAIPGGMFQMGSHHEGGYEDERPVHPVFLKSFWLGQYPVTQAQWQAVMGGLPACRFHGADRPVENINWLDAHEFCARLSIQTGRSCRLPSEAEWEYACRAATSTPFSFGETITTDFANYVGDHTYQEEPPGIYRHGITPVGSFPPNPWGLYDMHGNVWEFCADNWSEDYSAAAVDGAPYLTGPQPESGFSKPWKSRLFGSGVFTSSKKSGTSHETATGLRVARGGSWHETPAHCRSAVRLKVAEDERMEYYGMRILLGDGG